MEQQQKRKETHINKPQLFDKGYRQYNGTKSLAQMVLKQMDINRQKKKKIIIYLGTDLASFPQINSSWIIDLNVNAKLQNS